LIFRKLFHVREGEVKFFTRINSDVLATSLKRWASC
jgi:hypothetical protein